MAQVIKSGWLYRQSTILHKWKRSWVELYSTGVLKYFESETSSSPEGTINLPADCSAIKTGKLVEGVSSLPPGHHSAWLLAVEAGPFRTYVFCGDSLDDMKAWHLSIEQARLANYTVRHSPDYTTTYYTYPGYNYGGGSSVTYVAPPGGYFVPGAAAAPGTTVIYTTPRYRQGVQGRDLAVGVLAGAAMGSMLWAPMLWW